MSQHGTFEDSINDHLVFLVSACRPASTRYLRGYQLRRFAREHPGRAIDSFSLDDIAGWLGSHSWALETMRSYRACLRGFFRWAHSSGRVAQDPTVGLAPITPPRGSPRPAPDGVVAAGLAGADDRLRLMIRLAREVGLRRGEIARVHSRDLIEEHTGRWSLRVHGKGGHVRVLPLPAGVAVMLRALPAGWAFPGQVDGHLSAPWVGKLISRALPAGWSAHPLRHAFATSVNRSSGHNLRVVQELLGHASIATTQRYVEVTRDELRAAIDAA